MIKNIIILVLILVLGGMTWLTVSDDPKGTLANIEHLSQQAQEVTARVDEFWPAKSQEKASQDTITDLPLTNPLHGNPSPAAEARPATVQGPEPLQTVPQQEAHKSESPISPSIREEAAKGVVREAEDSGGGEPQAQQMLEAKAPKSEDRVSARRPLSSRETGKRDLNQGELSEILSLLKTAKDTLRRTFITVRPKPVVQPPPSDSDDDTSIKKKFDDGPSEQG